MRDKILFVLLALLILAGVAGFFYFFESYETEQDIGYSRKARQLPFLAAEQFLQGLGREVNSKNNLLDFDAITVDDIIFLSKVNSILLTPTQVDKAVVWLQKGGQIIVGVGDETGSLDSLLARFDITAAERESKEFSFFEERKQDEKLSDQLKRQNERFDKQQAEQQAKKNEAQDAAEEVAANEEKQTEEVTDLISVTFDNVDEPLSIKLRDNIYLQHPYLDKEGQQSENLSDLDYELISWAENDSGYHLMQFEVGEGMLTVLSTSEMWKNYTIDELDNAYLLAELVGDADRVHFYFNLRALPLRQLLIKYFPEALGVLIAALLFWLWRGFIRVSRIEGETTGQRRALSEHLAATTELFAKHKRYDLLVEPIVADIEQHMSSIVGSFEQRNVNEKIELLVLHSGLDHQLINDWFESVAQTTDNETFLKVVKIGKMIRNRL